MGEVVFISGLIHTYQGDYTYQVFHAENTDGSLAGIYKVSIYKSTRLVHDAFVNDAEPTTLEASKQYAIKGTTENGGGIWEEENGNDDENGGIENGGRARILNVAGYWTIGVAQGTLFMLVPMVMVGLSVGFMQRVVKLGAKVGGE